MGVLCGQLFLWLNVIIYDIKNIYGFPVLDVHMRLIGIFYHSYLHIKKQKNKAIY